MSPNECIKCSSGNAVASSGLSAMPRPVGDASNAGNVARWAAKAGEGVGGDGGGSGSAGTGGGVYASPFAKASKCSFVRRGGRCAAATAALWALRSALYFLRADWC